MLDNGGCIASLPHLDFLKIHSALATSFRMADGGSRLNRLLFFYFLLHCSMWDLTMLVSFLTRD